MKTESSDLNLESLLLSALVDKSRFVSSNADETLPILTKHSLLLAKSQINLTLMNIR